MEGLRWMACPLATGQELMELNRAERATAQAEADALSASFEAEEQTLAARRPLLTREAFAELAADFDRRVRLADHCRLRLSADPPATPNLFHDGSRRQASTKSTTARWHRQPVILGRQLWPNKSRRKTKQQ